MKRGSIFETDGIPRIQEVSPLPLLWQAQLGLRIRTRSFLFRQLW